MARPTKLTEKTLDMIVMAVRAGLGVDLACEMAGVSRRSFYRWMASAHPEHRQLREAVQVARTYARGDLDARMTRAAQCGNWRAAAWLLERQYPQRWGLRAVRRRRS